MCGWCRRANMAVCSARERRRVQRGCIEKLRLKCRDELRPFSRSLDQHLLVFGRRRHERAQHIVGVWACRRLAQTRTVLCFCICSGFGLGKAWGRILGRKRLEAAL